MTLFGGLVITFLDFDKERCMTNCSQLKANSELTAQGIGYAIIFFNIMYLAYFSFGLLLHGYYVLIPPSLRCQKVEEAASATHKKIQEHAPGVHKALFPNHHHKYRDNHALHQSNSSSAVSIEIKAERIMKEAKEDKRQLAKHLASGQKNAHKRVQERLLKKKQEQQRKKNAKQNSNSKNQKEFEPASISIEMTEGKNGGKRNNVVI